MMELVLSHECLDVSHDPKHWAHFLQCAEFILNSRLTHIDAHDPVRRKASTAQDTGEYICAFEPNETSRSLFGEFRGIGCDVSIDLWRSSSENYDEIKWYAQPPFTENEGCWRQLIDLFDLGNRMFTPFYAYAEDYDWLTKWSKPILERPERTNSDQELLGIFWMTYFSAAYVDFFGAETFSDLPNVKYNADGGATITLADRPQNVPDGLRDEIAAKLGKQSFTELDVRYLLPKRRGKHVLTFDQLRAFDAEHGKEQA